MKTAYKIVLINLVIAVIVTALSLMVNRSDNSVSNTALVFGLVCLGLSLLNLFVGIIMYFTKNKEWGNGMLISFAILLLLSGISCSQGFHV
ncbi:MAG: hypothetical protein M3R72_09195 [Bacteroidota bacterium]|nr:hypothetical protein [Bacteroidota bacterium]